MAFVCYRATESGCAKCPYCRFDPERGEKVCFGGKEAPAEDNYYNFLERLRKSGVTNMYGAAPYLVSEFMEVDYEKAGEILGYWMVNYAELSEKYGWRKN